MMAAGSQEPSGIPALDTMQALSRYVLRFCLLLILALVASAFSPPAGAQPSFVGVTSAISTGSKSSKTITISKPSGVTTGDVMLFVTAIQGGTKISVSTVASGWTLSLRTSLSTTLTQVVYYKVATAAEASSYTFKLSGASNSAKAAAALLVYRGADTSPPVKAAVGLTDSSGSSVTTPASSTTVANSLVLNILSIADGSNAAFTPPAGSTERVDVETGSSSGTAVGVSDRLQAAVGAVAGVTVTNGSSSSAIAQTLVLSLPDTATATPSSFNAFDTSTATGSVTGNIQTKVAGQSFDVALVALNAAGTGVLTSFTGAVKVELLDSSDGSGALVSGSNCRSSWTLVQTLAASQTFTSGNNGRVTLSGNLVAGAYRNARIRITYTSGGTTKLGCSTDAFAIRPASFSTPVVTDATWKTAGTTRALTNTGATGGVVHAAGQPFRVTANALSATSAVTTGYDGTPLLVFGTCVLPSTCEVGVSDGLSATFVSTAGVVVSTDAAFEDVGVISFTVQDANFAAVDSGDGSTAAQRLITSPSVTVGRFVPDSYLIELANVPQLLPAQAVGCTSRTDWNFTWIGQPFSWATVPSITVTAQDAIGNPVQQYAGSLYKLTTSAVSLVWASNAPAGAAFSATGQTATLTTGTLGVSTLTLGSAASFQFARPTSPVSPFNAVITLTINIADTTEAAVTGNGTIAAEAALVIDGDPLGSGTGIEFQGTNAAGANLQTYGRLQLAGANGDSRRPLSLVYETQAWSGAAWYRNQRDSCFTLAATNVALSSWTGNTTTCDASVSAVTQATRGQGVVKLSAPLGARSVGASATLRLNAASGTTCVANASASATGAAKAWLQGPWTSATGLYNTDPAARVTWGRVRNDILMRREQ